MSASSTESIIRKMYRVFRDTCTNTAEAGYGKKARQGRKKHTGGALEGRRARTSHLRFIKSESFYDDEDRIIYQWVPRGKLVEDAKCVGDIDWFRWRARHSTGWKDHKYRYQWEHNASLKEKHQKNHDRKRLRKGMLCP